MQRIGKNKNKSNKCKINNKDSAHMKRILEKENKESKSNQIRKSKKRN